MSVPREPDHYHPTTHCIDRVKQRDINWEFVSQTIQHGTVKNSHREGCKLFIQDFQGLSDPVGVVANVETGHILTVEWRR